MKRIHPYSDKLKLSEVKVGEVYMILTTSDRKYFGNRNDRQGPRFGKVVSIGKYRGFKAGERDDDIPKNQLAHAIAENASVFSYDTGDESGDRSMVIFRALDRDGNLTDRLHACTASAFVCTKAAWDAQQADDAERDAQQEVVRERERKIADARVSAQRAVLEPWFAEHGLDHTGRNLPKPGEVNLQLERYADYGYVTLNLKDFARLVGIDLPTGE